jgi:RNA polymerase sigma-70 factor (ECF subfamily)
MGWEDEIRLMQAIKGGSWEAFEELYHRYKDPIANYFYRMCWDTHLVEDLVQETFLRIWKGARSYTPRSKLSTYIFKIAHNLWVTHLRKASRVQIGLGSLEPITPLEDLVQHELSEKLKEAIGHLPEGEREVMILSIYSRLKYAEIAEILEIPVGTVKSRIFSAIKRLRERLRPYLKG